MIYNDTKNGRFYNDDTFKAMQDIPDGVIDMLLVDLPYGTTACAWDSVLPFNALWEAYNRVCKSNAAMVFTAAQPFTSALVMSNIKNFKYAWIWRKNKPQGFMNAKKRPLKDTEDVLVFSNGTPLYKPQGLVAINKTVKNTGTKNALALKEDSDRSAANGSIKSLDYTQEFTNYPRTIIEFSNAGSNQIHPTQKPIELFEYLIRTYTNEGDIVLDNTAGSGTTAIAAINTNRKWVCVEKDEEYYRKAIERINAHVL